MEAMVKARTGASIMWFRDKVQRMAAEQPTSGGKLGFMTTGLNKLRRLIAKKSKVGRIKY